MTFYGMPVTTPAMAFRSIRGLTKLDLYALCLSKEIWAREQSTLLVWHEAKLG
jgi:hypothetical protein